MHTKTILKNSASQNFFEKEITTLTQKKFPQNSQSGGSFKAGFCTQFKKQEKPALGAYIDVRDLCGLFAVTQKSQYVTSQTIQQSTPQKTPSPAVVLRRDFARSSRNKKSPRWERTLTYVTCADFSQ